MNQRKQRTRSQDPSSSLAEVVEESDPYLKMFEFVMHNIAVYESLREFLKAHFAAICRAVNEINETTDGSWISMLADAFNGDSCWGMTALGANGIAKRHGSSLYRITDDPCDLSGTRVVKKLYSHKRDAATSRVNQVRNLELELDRHGWILSLRGPDDWTDIDDRSCFGIVFICFKPRDALTLRIGRAVSHDGRALAPAELLIEADCFTGDNSGAVTTVLFKVGDVDARLLKQDSFPYFVTDQRDPIGNVFDSTRDYMLNFQTHFGTWRQLFKSNAEPIARTIAAVLSQTRNIGLCETVAFSEHELIDAFISDDQRYAFELSDLNDFSGDWESTVVFYNNQGIKAMQIRKFQTWLSAGQMCRGIYQRKTASATQYIDPLKVTGTESELIEVLLQAYIPELGFEVGWLSKFQPFPSKDESGKDVELFFETPLLAYRLAGNRFLWLSQRFTRNDLKSVNWQTGHLSLPNQYDIAIEWIETQDGQHSCFLVNDTFEIDPKTKTFSRAHDAMLLKVRHEARGGSHADT